MRLGHNLEDNKASEVVVYISPKSSLLLVGLEVEMHFCELSAAEQVHSVLNGLAVSSDK